MTTKIDYEHKALLYAERYGIIEYKVKGNIMTWRETHRGEGTYRYELNLFTGKAKNGVLVSKKGK